ncbi:DUF3095 domain-containing protein [Pseudophaeobacter sp.]|jgi:hypothetical protein|uniref:DUF3095 domain-containing protein n=1 Tax=Pseudophaeobacter sp. TaxID=1971739 RepID=UPI003A984BA4
MTKPDGFYDALPRQPRFANLAQPTAFTPLPDDWVICCSDIVDSTGLIAAGRYKTVNMIAAAVIAALQNAVEGAAFPFVFGGDGTSFAVPAAQADTSRRILVRLRNWVQQEFGIALRVAAIPLAKVRAQGLDVTVARHAVSDHADYAMFSGGGLAWAEAEMKQGRFMLAESDDHTPPDLTGLSCRWNTIPARNGLILSLVMLPGPLASAARFAEITAEILALTAKLARGGHPVPVEGPGMNLLPPDLMLETKLTHGSRSLWKSQLALLGSALLASLLFRRNKPTGQFNPTRYKATMSANADYRKFDDGLKMTLDCTPEIRDQITAILYRAQAAQEVRFGLHSQQEARLTCIVPSASRDDHVHFVDGSAGGYTRAAKNMGKTIGK